jgi:hypothetical protein
MIKYALFTQSDEYTIEFTKKITKPEILVARNNNINAKEFINYNDAYSGKYSKKNENELKPINNNILTQMAYAEAIVMRMMDRTTIRENYYHRQKIYRKHLEYWYTTLDQVDVLVFHVLPHEVFDFIAYSCAKIKNIKTYFYYTLPSLPPSFLMYIAEDINNQSQRVSEAFNDNNYSCESKNDYQEDLINIYNGLVNDPVEKRISYTGIEVNKFKNNQIKILDKIKTNFRMFLFNISQIFGEEQSYQILKTGNIEKNKYKHDFKEIKSRYIYFPLHYQPEASSNPIGEFYEDQLLIIKLLLNKIKDKDLLLVIKEHPRQIKGTRKKEFYEYFNKNRKNEKLIVVDKNTSSHLLLSNSSGVITISGTIAWEALFAGKPALMFGSRIFDTAPGIIKVNSDDSIEYYLNNLENIDVGILNSKWEFYCKILQKFLIPGTNATYYYDLGIADEKICAQNATDGLIKYLNKKNI